MWLHHGSRLKMTSQTWIAPARKSDNGRKCSTTLNYVSKGHALRYSTAWFSLTVKKQMMKSQNTDSKIYIKKIQKQIQRLDAGRSIGSYYPVSFTTWPDVEGSVLSFALRGWPWKVFWAHIHTERESLYRFLMERSEHHTPSAWWAVHPWLFKQSSSACWETCVRNYRSSFTSHHSWP